MANLPTMDWQSPNIAKTFSLFKQRLELKNTPKAKKVPPLLLSSGEEGLKRYNSWTGAPERGRVSGFVPPGFRGEGVPYVITPPPCFWKANLIKYCLNK